MDKKENEILDIEKRPKLDGIKELTKLKGLTGVVKIALIFVGVLVCLIVALPLAPFLVTYFMYDRNRTHKERMSKVNKRKPLESVNNWANDRTIH